MAYRSQNYRPSPLQRIASGMLAVYTGQQQGQLAREQRDEEDAQHETRAAIQHLMQFSQMERQGFDQQQDRFKTALSAPGLAPDSRNALVQQMLQSSQGFSPTDVSPMLQQLYNRKRGQKVNVQFPQMRQQQQVQMPQLKFADPYEEAELKEALDTIRDDAQQAATFDQELAGRIRGLGQEAVSRKRPLQAIMAEAEMLRSSIRSKEQERMDLQKGKEKRMVDSELADIEFRNSSAAAAQAQKDQINADRDEARAYKQENDARNYNSKLSDDILAARKTGNVQALKAALEQQAKHAGQFSKIIGPYAPEYSDEPMRVNRGKSQIDQRIPTPFGKYVGPNNLGVVEGEDEWEDETPEEVAFRKSRYLASLLEDPTLKAKADKDALKDLWGVFKSGRWTSLTPAVRASIINQIGEFGSKLYDQKDLFPPGLKDVQFTPAEIESKRRWEITNTRAQENQRMKRESHSRNIAAADKNLEIAEQKAKGLYKPGGDKNNSGYFAIQAAISDLKESRDAYKEAMKNPEAGFRDKTTARWAQEVNERRAALDAVIANPQATVERIQQEQGMVTPPQKQAAPPRVTTQDLGPVPKGKKWAKSPRLGGSVALTAAEFAKMKATKDPGLEWVK